MGPKVKYFLNVFYKTTGFKPQAILFFRDGVSEGQFHTVSFKYLWYSIIYKINGSLTTMFYYNTMRWQTKVLYVLYMSVLWTRKTKF